MEYCTHCGKECERTWEIEGDSLCYECREALYAQCECCKEWFAKPLLADVQGHLLCEECESSHSVCHGCGTIIPSGDAYSVEDDDQAVFCEDCLDTEVYVCASCGERFYHYESVVSDEDTTLCRACAEEYSRCRGCGHLIPDDELEEINGRLYCPRCAEGELEDSLQPYSYKPRPRFYCTDDDPAHPLYFGVELEMSHDSPTDMGLNLSACQEYFPEEYDFFYLKRDSSLLCGFEMVSHPRTLSSWHKLLPSMEEYFDEVRDLVLEGRDGLHVHISRKGMSPAHMVRFGSFFAAEQDNIVLIARRNSNEWARYHSKPKTGFDAQWCARNDSRYEAVNWANTFTVEVRVFRSTLDIIEFYAAIEFCHAAYLFTKREVNINQIIQGRTWPLFLRFLKTDKKRYEHLIKFWEAL